MRYACAAEDRPRVEARLAANIREYVGPGMRLEMEFCGVEELRRGAGLKFRSVVSRVGE